MANKDNFTGDPGQPMIYQIRLRGHLDGQWTEWFEGLTIKLEDNGDTLLTGPVADQSALHGLLRKVRDLGIPLLSLTCLPPEAEAGWQDASRRLMSRIKRSTSMNDLQRAGGIDALVQVAAYLVGFGLFLAVLAPVQEAEPARYVAFLVENQSLMHLWHLVIYVVAGIFLVVLALALHERLQSGAPALSQVAAAFGLIWAGLLVASGMLLINDARVVAALYGRDPAGAVSVWLAFPAVEKGLGSAVELPGGLWMLLVSLAALRAGELGRGLSYLGVVIGLAGILTAVPALQDAGIVFGLGAIAWFAWVGAVMTRRRRGSEQLSVSAAS